MPKRYKNYIPYSHVYESQNAVREHGYWIPDLPIYATIIGVENDISTYHMFNPFIYTIQMEHGKFQWTIKKRYNDFAYLSQRLLAHRVAETIKAPARKAKRTIQNIYMASQFQHRDGVPFKNNALDGYFVDVFVLARSKELEELSESDLKLHGKKENSTICHYTNDPLHSLPHFPKTPDSVIPVDQINKRKTKLEAWLRHMLSIPVNKDYHEMAEFLEISRYSFINEIGGKYKEGKMKKKPGGGRVYGGLKQCCDRFFVPWSRRWLLVKDTYVCYMNPKTETIRAVLVMDKNFSINSVDVAKNNREFIVSNQRHVLHVKCKREEEASQWKNTIQSVISTTGNIWLTDKPYGSSYPVRRNNYTQWFVDAKTYMAKAADMIEIARDEIFITDWFLSPEIYMKRPIV